MLAERVRTPLLVAIAAILLGVTAFAVWPCEAQHNAKPVPAIIVSGFPTADSIEITDFCPPHVRAAMHLDSDAH